MKPGVLVAEGPKHVWGVPTSSTRHWRHDRRRTGKLPDEPLAGDQDPASRRQPGSASGATGEETQGVGRGSPAWCADGVGQIPTVSVTAGGVGHRFLGFEQRVPARTFGPLCTIEASGRTDHGERDETPCPAAEADGERRQERGGLSGGASLSGLQLHDRAAVQKAHRAAGGCPVQGAGPTTDAWYQGRQSGPPRQGPVALPDRAAWGFSICETPSVPGRRLHRRWQIACLSKGSPCRDRVRTIGYRMGTMAQTVVRSGFSSRDSGSAPGSDDCQGRSGAFGQGHRTIQGRHAPDSTCDSPERALRQWARGPGPCRLGRSGTRAALVTSRPRRPAPGLLRRDVPTAMPGDADVHGSPRGSRCTAA